jgi:hypothetical protein
MALRADYLRDRIRMEGPRLVNIRFDKRACMTSYGILGRALPCAARQSHRASIILDPYIDWELLKLYGADRRTALEAMDVIMDELDNTRDSIGLFSDVERSLKQHWRSSSGPFHMDLRLRASPNEEALRLFVAFALISHLFESRGLAEPLNQFVGPRIKDIAQSDDQSYMWGTAIVESYMTRDQKIHLLRKMLRTNQSLLELHFSTQRRYPHMQRYLEMLQRVARSMNMTCRHLEKPALPHRPLSLPPLRTCVTGGIDPILPVHRFADDSDVSEPRFPIIPYAPFYHKNLHGERKVKQLEFAIHEQNEKIDELYGLIEDARTSPLIFENAYMKY